ncbi:MAG: phosphoenolpyruvate carboxykinase (ATP), partial [Elusimicrobiota bacterium]|nr:phosphoenolpyruvate carboxykinase (ATP) [Elusimicrobiota bacterium]
MPETQIKSEYGLENIGLKTSGKIYWNLPVPVLYEHVVKRGEGNVVEGGPIIVETGKHTARAAKDKFT